MKNGTDKISNPLYQIHCGLYLLKCHVKCVKFLFLKTGNIVSRSLQKYRCKNIAAKNSCENSCKKTDANTVANTDAKTKERQMSLDSIGYLGPYRLLNVINTGQSSRLWQAYDDRNRQYVGIKTLLDQFSRQREQVQILKWEYDVASKFSDPKLVKIIEFAWHQRNPYLVMEWFSAPNLKMWINRGYAEYCKYLPAIMPAMAEALLYLHTQGWVHRDVKPDNFLFSDETSELKLIDFALARKTVSGIGKLFSMRSKTQGTASYMSPEQIQGLPPEPSSDIYSLGCTFFELLTTKLPFAGESMGDLLRKHLSTSPPAITTRNKNLTPEFVNLHKLMMMKKPADRFKTTAEFVKHIKGIRIFRGQPKPEDI